MTARPNPAEALRAWIEKGSEDAADKRIGLELLQLVLHDVRLRGWANAIEGDEILEAASAACAVERFGRAVERAHIEALRRHVQRAVEAWDVWDNADDSLDDFANKVDARNAALEALRKHSPRRCRVIEKLLTKLALVPPEPEAL